jgi:hypothetical protein
MLNNLANIQMLAIEEYKKLKTFQKLQLYV